MTPNPNLNGNGTMKYKILFLFFVACTTNSFAETVKCVDQKGKVSYSNTVCPNDTIFKRHLNGTPTLIPKGSNFSHTSLSMLRSQMKMVAEENDPMERIRKNNALAVQLEIFKAEAKEKAYKQAEVEYRVPDLERRLTESIAVDDQFRARHNAAGDSPPTAEIRNQLMDAKKAALLMYENYYDSNPEVQGAVGEILYFIKTTDTTTRFKLEKK